MTIMTKMNEIQFNEYLSLPNIAHFITNNETGYPHSVPVWYEFVDGCFYVFAPAYSAKVRNLKRNPKLTLSIASEDQPYRYVTVSGNAEFINGDYQDQLVSIASRYEGVPGGEEIVAEFQAQSEIVLIALKPSNRLVTFSSKD